MKKKQMVDKETTIEQLKQIVKEFNEERDWGQFHDPKELAIILSTESNELLSIFRFKNSEQMKEILDSDKRVEVEDELADILNGLLRFAQMYDIDLCTAFAKKMEQNRKKYPVQLCKGKNKKYSEYKK